MIASTRSGALRSRPADASRERIGLAPVENADRVFLEILLLRLDVGGKAASRQFLENEVDCLGESREALKGERAAPPATRRSVTEEDPGWRVEVHAGHIKHHSTIRLTPLGSTAPFVSACGAAGATGRPSEPL